MNLERLFALSYHSICGTFFLGEHFLREMGNVDTCMVGIGCNKSGRLINECYSLLACFACAS